MTNVEAARYAIIGAGFAGAAAAYHLTQAGERDVVVLETEPTPGVHASGRNAAMARQLVADPHVARLVCEGARFIRERAADLNEGQPLLTPNGSLLLGNSALIDPLLSANDGETHAEVLPIGETVRRFPFIAGTGCELALWCPSDGVIDVHGLLHGYLRASRDAGARLLTSCWVESIGPYGGGFELSTTQGTVRTDILINAAGAWASEIGQLAGATAAPIRACRRHLVSTPPLEWVEPRWPFTWDMLHEVYLRPESGGLLLSGCDEEDMQPCLPPVDRSVLESLARKLSLHFPSLPTLEVQRIWAGLRTLTPDGRFLIGWDPQLDGFFWVAGLGGQGVTSSSAVGRLAVDLLFGRPRHEAGVFDPARFA